MKKWIMAGLITILVSFSNSLVIAAEIKLTVDDAKKARVVEACKGLFPIPMIPDPNFVGDKEAAPKVPQFTDEAWPKEMLRRFLIQTVQRYEAKKAMETAAATVAPDNALAQ